VCVDLNKADAMVVVGYPVSEMYVDQHFVGICCYLTSRNNVFKLQNMLDLLVTFTCLTP